MNLWYFLKRNKVVGPVKAEEVKKRLRAKELGPYDLVFREGDDKWLPLHEYSEFTKILETMEVPDPTDLWVVLKKKDKSEGKGFVQSGPFAASDIVRMIKSGQVKYTDYVWKEGMKEWYRISSVDELSVSRPKAPELKVATTKMPRPPEEDETTRVSKKIVQLSRKVETLTDVAPKEAISEDEVSEGTLSLTKGLLTDPTLKEKKRLKHQVRVSQKEAVKPEKVRKRSHKMIEWMKNEWLLELAIFVFCASLGTLLVILWPKQELEELVIEKEVEQEVPVVKEVQKERSPRAKPLSAKKQSNQLQTAKAEPPKDNKPPANPKVTATYLKLKAMTVDGDLGFRALTDASDHFQVSFVVTSLAGKNIGARGVAKLIRRTAGKRIDVTMNSLGVPAGEYKVVAEINNISSRISLRYGINSTKNYRGQLNSRRKALAFTSQSERVGLFRSSSKLYKLADNLLKSTSQSSKTWPLFYRRWKKAYRGARRGGLAEISYHSANKFVFPNTWMGLLEHWKKLGEVAAQWGGATQKEKVEFRADLTKIRSEFEKVKHLKKGVSLFH